MTVNDDLKALLKGGELDRDAVSRLKARTPDEVRALLSKYLPAREVDAIVERIRSLVVASADDGSAGAWAGG